MRRTNNPIVTLRIVAFVFLSSISTVHMAAAALDPGISTGPLASVDQRNPRDYIGAPAPTPGTSGAQWNPAGPMVDKINISTYSTLDSEFKALQNNLVDLPGTALTTAWANTFSTQASVYVTAPSATGQWAYRAGWKNIVNDVQSGVPSIFSLLNTWSPTSNGIARWGFVGGTSSLNPFLFTTPQESRVLREIYDQLIRNNPYDSGQSFAWMVNQWQALPAQPGDPAGTVADYKFNLRNDIFFQDGTQLTSSDYKFSVLGYKQIPGSQSSLVSHVLDVRIMNDFNFIVNLDTTSSAELTNIGSILIVPQHVWALNTLSKCEAQGTPSCMVNTVLVTGPGADASGLYHLIGSGPFICRDLVTSLVGGHCTSTASDNAPVGSTIILQRNGLGLAGTSNSAYFRSSEKYKQWQWADVFNHGSVDILDVSSAAGCLGKTATGACAHWDTPAATMSCITTAGTCNAGSLAGLGVNNAGNVSFLDIQQSFRWFGVSWTSPISYPTLTDSEPIPQTLYEGGLQYA